MNRKRSSYGLKHDAERMSGDYVANGMMIAAALAMGLFRTHPFRFTQRPFQHLFETNLLHNAYRLALDGPSMRDPKTAKSDTTGPGVEMADATATKPTKAVKK